MILTERQFHLLKVGDKNEYISVGPDDYEECEVLHKAGLIELGFVVPGIKHYWLTGKGRQKIYQGG